MEFNKGVKIKCLLWCDRYCCFCNKPCSTNIEIAHISQNKTDPDDIDNAIPLCFDCHAKIGHYNQKHPKGNKIGEDELKARRNQIYEEHTRHLVPPIDLQITQNLLGIRKRQFPDIGFTIQHLWDFLPVKVLVGIEIFLDKKCLKRPADGSGPYGLDVPWNMNPRTLSMGHFDVKQAVGNKKRLRITVHAIIIDSYDRHHKLLPMSWVYARDDNSWFYDP